MRERRSAALEVSRRLVREQGLTDLCLHTEARYTRHPSQADLHSAFQDHPFALEHFPTGSLLPPPKNLLEWLQARPEAVPASRTADEPERAPVR